MSWQVPDVQDVAKTIDLPAKMWPGNCYGIAMRLTKKEVVPSGTVAVYGHFLGPVETGTRFYRRYRQTGWVQHGWCLLPDGSIVDPTRWVFEDCDPYIAHLKPGTEEYEQYDEGGNAFRERRKEECPSFDIGDGSRSMKLHGHCTPEVLSFVEELTQPHKTPYTVAQIHWLATLPYSSLEPQALDVYTAIEAVCGHNGLIPVDNYKRARRGQVVCWKCRRPSNEDEYCFGCQKYVCEDCDVSGDVMGHGHSVERHFIQEDEEEWS